MSEMQIDNNVNVNGNVPVSVKVNTHDCDIGCGEKTRILLPCCNFSKCICVKCMMKHNAARLNLNAAVNCPFCRDENCYPIFAEMCMANVEQNPAIEERKNELENLRETFKGTVNLIESVVNALEVPFTCADIGATINNVDVNAIARHVIKFDAPIELSSDFEYKHSFEENVNFTSSKPKIIGGRKCNITGQINTKKMLLTKGVADINVAKQKIVNEIIKCQHMLFAAAKINTELTAFNYYQEDMNNNNN